jgi:hypothetical protein
MVELEKDYADILNEIEEDQTTFKEVFGIELNDLITSKQYSYGEFKGIIPLREFIPKGFEITSEDYTGNFGSPYTEFGFMEIERLSDGQKFLILDDSAIYELSFEDLCYCEASSDFHIVKIGQHEYIIEYRMYGEGGEAWRLGKDGHGMEDYIGFIGCTDSDEARDELKGLLAKQKREAVKA